VCVCVCVCVCACVCLCSIICHYKVQLASGIHLNIVKNIYCMLIDEITFTSQGHWHPW